MNYGLEFDLVVRISMTFSLTIAEFFMSTFHFYVLFKNRSLVLIRILTVSVIEMINKFLWFIYIRSYEHIRHFGKLFFFLSNAIITCIHLSIEAEWTLLQAVNVMLLWSSFWFFFRWFFLWSSVHFYIHIEYFFLPQNKMQIQ